MDIPISRPNETILLDCDGVCSDFIAQLRAVCIYAGILFPESVDSWDIFSKFGKDRSKVYDLICRPGFCSKMPKILRAEAGVLGLRNMGFEVVAVTAPFVSSRVWEVERRAWLAKNLNIGKEDVIFTFRKELVCGVTLIDDKPEYVNKWSKVQGRPSFLFDRTYNRKANIHPLVTRVDGWTDLLEKFTALQLNSNLSTPYVNPFDPLE